MFRKPRESSSGALVSEVESSIGRPPTPPSTPAKTPFTLAVPPNVPPPRMAASKSKANKNTPLPVIGRQGLVGSAKKPSSTPKVKDKGNANITSFFKKSEQENGLFIEEKNSHSIDRDAIGKGFILGLRTFIVSPHIVTADTCQSFEA